MSGWVIWIVSGIAALVVAAALIEAYLKRNRKRSLVDMRPDPQTLKRRPWEADGVIKVDDMAAAQAQRPKDGSGGNSPSANKAAKP